MEPLIKVLIILTVSIILGLLIIPRIKKGKYRMEGGVIHTHIHTHTHSTKNIIIIISMSIVMVGGLLALVWQQVGQASKDKAVKEVQDRLDKQTAISNAQVALKNAEDTRDDKVAEYIAEMGVCGGSGNFCSTQPGSGILTIGYMSNVAATKHVHDNNPPPTGCKTVIGYIKEVNLAGSTLYLPGLNVGVSWAPSDACQSYFDNPTSKQGWTDAQKTEIAPYNDAVQTATTALNNAQIK